MATLDIAEVEPKDSAPVPQFVRRRLGVAFWIAAAWIAFVVVLAAGADFLPLQDPTRMNIRAVRAAPSAAHWLGTDVFGRDILSRLIYGARNSLTIGLAAPILGVTLGTALGLPAAYFRGWFEIVSVGAMDVLLAFPPLVLALAIAAYFGTSVWHLVLILGILTMPTAMRVTRAVSLTLAQREYVTAARALGATHLRIMLREMLPTVGVVLVVFVLVSIAVIIVVEGALSFIGLGVPAPAPSWGAMIAEGRAALDSAPHIAFMPSATMFLTVLALNYVGDKFRGLVDPRWMS
jgi:peptide/nickel transport system permease protein